MLSRNAILSNLLLLLFLAGCQRSKTPAITPKGPIATPTPVIQVVKTEVGVGREIRGPLLIEDDCARVAGEALAWDPMIKASIDGEALRVLRKWNGQVSVFHAGELVRVDGSCIIKKEGEPCGTPSMEEAGAVTGCDAGPYFVAGNIRPVFTPAPVPPSP